jgi:hypothetical protein
MNEVNEQSLPAGRLGGVVEFIPDEVVQIWCHLPFPCLFIIGNTDLTPWDLIRSRQRFEQMTTTTPIQVHQPLVIGDILV